jgi:hypothetical protein
VLLLQSSTTRTLQNALLAYSSPPPPTFVSQIFGTYLNTSSVFSSARSIATLETYVLQVSMLFHVAPRSPLRATLRAHINAHFCSSLRRGSYEDTFLNLKIGKHTRVIFQGFTGTLLSSLLFRSHSKITSR